MYIVYNVIKTWIENALHHRGVPLFRKQRYYFRYVYLRMITLCWVVLNMAADELSVHVCSPGNGFISGRIIIQKHRSMLQRELNVSVLLPYLNKYHMLTTNLHDELTLPITTNAAKVEGLWLNCQRGGEITCKYFSTYHTCVWYKKPTSIGQYPPRTFNIQLLYPPRTFNIQLPSLTISVGLHYIYYIAFSVL